MKKVLIICGPTAVGKTKLAIELAKQFDGELINADSRQMYQGLSIISGKDIESGSKPLPQYTVSVGEQMYQLVTHDIQGISVWLYDVFQPKIVSSIVHFYKLASYVIGDITKRGKLPIVVGGSGFYLSSLVSPIDTFSVPRNDTLRASLESESIEVLQAKVATGNPARWEHMNTSDRNNPRRLIRAIEVLHWKKKHTQNNRQEESFDIMWIGLRLPDDELSRRIDKRVKDRFVAGALEEAKAMQEVSQKFPASSTIGLPTLLLVLRGKLSLAKAKEIWAKEEIQYTKRQMTWFRKQAYIQWFDMQKDGVDVEVEKRVRQWYNT